MECGYGGAGEGCEEGDTGGGYAAHNVVYGVKWMKIVQFHRRNGLKSNMSVRSEERQLCRVTMAGHFGA